MTFPGWDSRLLGALGVTPTRARLAFLHAWAACEGGSARFNPLNTTFHLAGATDFNSAGVKHYLDAHQGTAATLLTMRLHFYDELRAALATDHLMAEQIARRSARSLDVWGTGHECVEQRTRGT